MSILPVIGSVLGGLLGRSKQKVISAGDNFMSHIGGLMEAAKKYGFNPLTLLQNGQAIGPTVLNSDNSAFGAGIANAFALAGDAITAKRGQTQKLNDYQNANKRLTAKVNAITLRAPTPGVYGSAKMPSDPEVYSDGTASSYVAPVSGARGPAGSGSAPLRAIGDVDPGDPRRTVDVKPTPNSPGFMVVDNPYLPKMWFPTIDGDEPLDLLDIPSVAVGGPQLAYGFGHTMSYGGGSESRPTYSRDSWEKAVRDNKAKAPPRPKPRPYERMGRDGALPLRRRDQVYSF